MATRYLTHLERLRGHVRVERRKLAERMATSQNMPRSFTKLLDLQSEFDAISRAIEDETKEARESAAKAAERAAHEDATKSPRP